MVLGHFHSRSVTKKNKCIDCGCQYFGFVPKSWFLSLTDFPTGELIILSSPTSRLLHWLFSLFVYVFCRWFLFDSKLRNSSLDICCFFPCFFFLFCPWLQHVLSWLKANSEQPVANKKIQVVFPNHQLKKRTKTKPNQNMESLCLLKKKKNEKHQQKIFFWRISDKFTSLVEL